MLFSPSLSNYRINYNTYLKGGKDIMDRGFELNEEYNNWTFTDEYGQMAIAYYLEELRKEELKNVV
jgi:hypothetical protein